jgi:site-specific recombinase XerD
MRLNSSTPAQDAPVLRQYLADFRVHLKSEGYSPNTIRVYLICLRVVDREAAAIGLDLHQLADRHLNGKPLVPGKRLLPNGFAALLAYLAKKKLLVPRGIEAQVKELLARFSHYLIQEAGLTAGTSVMHVRIAKRFLKYRFTGHELRTMDITARDVQEFLAQPNHHYRHISLGMKALLRFMYLKKLIAAPLAEGLPNVKAKNKQRLPRSMSAAQLESLLDGLSTATPTDRRNKAMIVLLARLGLRVGEVFRLTLDDIDWEEGTVLIRGKGDYFDRMPLSQDAGRHLLDYITQDRPETKAREVFVHERAPHGGIARTSLPIDFSGLLKRARIKTISHTGSRIFRHTFATGLIAKGASIQDTAHAMRHRRMQTTMVYARTDLERLRTVARPWPIQQRKRCG